MSRFTVLAGLIVAVGSVGVVGATHVSEPVVTVSTTSTTTTTVPPTTTTTTTTVPPTTTTTTTIPPTTTTTVAPKPPAASYPTSGNHSSPRIRRGVEKAAVKAELLGYDICEPIKVNHLEGSAGIALALRHECLIEVGSFPASTDTGNLEAWMAHEVAHLVHYPGAVHGAEFIAICRQLVEDRHEDFYCKTPGVLETAEAFVGSTPEELGFSDFWCAEFVELVLFQTGKEVDNPLDSPSRLMYELEPVANPEPGVVVGITYQGHQVDHVAIVAEVLPDGVRVIEGNGSNETAKRVGYNFWSYDMVYGYGR